MESSGQIIQLLEQYSAGDESVVDRLIPLVYPDLRRIAHRRLRSEPADLTLNTTALVHETYLNLVDQTSCDWSDRAHFFAVAARLMRRVLIDYARKKKAEKRGGGTVRVTLQEEMAATDPRFGDLLALDEALEALAAHDERMGRVVECRFFGGMTVEETAAALDVSTRTVERDWMRARAYLGRSLRPTERS